jgi:hypothetical protein
MNHNGHTPNIEAMPVSRSERAAWKIIGAYQHNGVDLESTFNGLLGMIARLGRSVTHLWQENKRLTARNAYLESENERANRRLQHMSYTPRYLSQGEIDGFARGQYVYVLHEVEVTGRFKIGKATLPRARFTEYTKWPFRWQVVCIIPTKDMHTLERQFHQQYQHKRIPGSEWFTLNPTDVLDIVTYTE